MLIRMQKILYNNYLKLKFVNDDIENYGSIFCFVIEDDDCLGIIVDEFKYDFSDMLRFLSMK